jgi:hypothetical protein
VCCTPNACGYCGAPPAEVCNGLDDDCDGLTDEASQVGPGDLCPRQQGVCSGSRAACRGAAGYQCDEGTYQDHSTSYESTESSCDGYDNDCDGATDETTECPSESYACASYVCEDGACTLRGDPQGTPCWDEGEHTQVAYCDDNWTCTAVDYACSCDGSYSDCTYFYYDYYGYSSMYAYGCYCDGYRLMMDLSGDGEYGSMYCSNGCYTVESGYHACFD